MATKSTQQASAPLARKASAPARAAHLNAVPAVLATPTDLPTAEVEDIVRQVNAIVSDAFTLYVKYKNFHWHLSGVHFRDLHLLFDTHADQVFATIDPLAERVRRIGGTTIRSVAHIGRLQTIEDDEQNLVEPLDMVRRLLADERHVVEAMRKLHETCDDAKDIATASLLEEYVDATENRAWFLFEIMQGLEAK